MTGNLPDDWPAGYYTCSACGVEAHASGAVGCLCADEQEAYEEAVALSARIRAELDETTTDWDLVVDMADRLRQIAWDQLFQEHPR